MSSNRISMNAVDHFQSWTSQVDITQRFSLLTNFTCLRRKTMSARIFPSRPLSHDFSLSRQPCVTSIVSPRSGTNTDQALHQGHSCLRSRIRAAVLQVVVSPHIRSIGLNSAVEHVISGYNHLLTDVSDFHLNPGRNPYKYVRT